TQLRAAIATDPVMEKGGPLPADLGAQADLYAEVRRRRLEADKAAAAIKERETEIYNVILSTLNESADTGAAGRFFRVQRVEKDVFNVENWDSLHAHIAATGDFTLLQRRLGEKAAQEITEATGAPPPGVKKVTIPVLSFTKI